MLSPRSFIIIIINAAESAMEDSHDVFTQVEGEAREDVRPSTAASEEEEETNAEKVGDVSTAHDVAVSSSSPSGNRTGSTAATPGPRGRKRATDATASSACLHIKQEPLEDTPSTSIEQPATEAGVEKIEKQRGEQPYDRTLPTAAGVSTRRSKSQQQQQSVKVEAEAAIKNGEGKTNYHNQRNGGGRSSSSGSEDRSDSDKENSTDLSYAAGLPSMSPTNEPSSSPASSTTQPTSPVTFAAALRLKHDEAVETATRAAVQAQERQLRHTLLSIFPAHLRHMDAEVSAPSHHSDKAQDKNNAANFAGAAATPHVFWATRCSPEPLLPLLDALCEDKTYVHAAWCRYEDDIAVQRAQNSIQRKRQRHSFSKGTRKPASSAHTTASAVGGGDHESSDSEDEFEEEGNQPPESEWVEAAPALTGSPPTTAAASNRLRAARGEAAMASGFQWTPWRFFREKRRRSTRRSPGNTAAALTVLGSPHPHASSTFSAAVGTTAVSTASESTAGASASAATTVTSTAARTATLASTAASMGGGVPPLALSEVPSLPVLQVDTEVPEDATEPVEAMTVEEQRNYARYVMSSGKLRNMCRDPYSFLVSRAKELRIQWERQHPFE